MIVQLPSGTDKTHTLTPDLAEVRFADYPPRRFSWRGHAHAVAAGDGPERIHGECWTPEVKTWAVREYLRVEDVDGDRYCIFRRAEGVHPATGDLSRWMHGRSCDGQTPL